jgi:hypothetical protein
VDQIRQALSYRRSPQAPLSTGSIMPILQTLSYNFEIRTREYNIFFDAVNQKRHLYPMASLRR